MEPKALGPQATIRSPIKTVVQLSWNPYEDTEYSTEGSGTVETVALSFDLQGLIQQSASERVYTLADLAQIFGIDRSCVRKYIHALGIQTARKHLGPTNQACLVFTEEQVKQILKRRVEDGYQLFMPR